MQPIRERQPKGDEGRRWNGKVRPPTRKGQRCGCGRAGSLPVSARSVVPQIGMTGPSANRPSLVPIPTSSRLLILLVAGAILLGCGSGETSIPRAWRPLRLGAASGDAPGCPPVAGTYGVDSELLFATLVGQHLPAAARDISWSAFSLQGEADSALTVTVMNAREGADTLRLRHGVAYVCADGWLTPTFPAAGLISDGTYESSSVLRGAVRDVFIAGANDGALVARLRTRTHDEIALWCGDGCRSMRVPFSEKSTVRWERQARLTSDVATIDPDDPRLRLDPRETRATRRIREALPPYVTLRGVGPREDGWHVSIDLPDNAKLVEVLRTLNATPGIADARVERLYETLNLEGSWHEVLWLRVTSR